MGYQGSPSQLLTRLCSTTHGCFKCKSRFSPTAPNLLFSWQRASPWTQLCNLTLTVTAGHSSSPHVKPTSPRLGKSILCLPEAPLSASHLDGLLRGPGAAASSSSVTSSPAPTHPHLLITPAARRLASSKGLPARAAGSVSSITPYAPLSAGIISDRPRPKPAYPRSRARETPDGVTEPRGRTEARTKHSDVHQAPQPPPSPASLDTTSATTPASRALRSLTPWSPV